jgi:hypothetical protein
LFLFSWIYCSHFRYRTLDAGLLSNLGLDEVCEQP